MAKFHTEPVKADILFELLVECPVCGRTLIMEADEHLNTKWMQSVMKSASTMLAGGRRSAEVSQHFTCPNEICKADIHVVSIRV